jgi:hypothetical protein
MTTSESIKVDNVGDNGIEGGSMVAMQHNSSELWQQRWHIDELSSFFSINIGGHIRPSLKMVISRDV